MKRGRTTTVTPDLDLTPVEHDDGTADVEWSACIYSDAGRAARDRWRRYSREHRTAIGSGDFPSVLAARSLIAGFAAVERKRAKR